MTHIEFAARCRVAPRTVLMWIDQGRLAAERVPQPPYRSNDGQWITPSQVDVVISDAEAARFLAENGEV